MIGFDLVLDDHNETSISDLDSIGMSLKDSGRETSSPRNQKHVS